MSFQATSLLSFPLLLLFGLPALFIYLRKKRGRGADSKKPSPSGIDEELQSIQNQFAKQELAKQNNQQQPADGIMRLPPTNWRAIGSKFLFVVALIVVSAAYYFIVIKVPGKEEQIRAHNTFVPVDAKILSSRIEKRTYTCSLGTMIRGRCTVYCPTIDYAYVVDGQSYNSSHYWFYPGCTQYYRAVASIVGQNLVGTVVKAWVDPADPSSAILDNSLTADGSLLTRANDIAIADIPAADSIEGKLRSEGKGWECTRGELVVGAYVEDSLEESIGQPKGRGRVGIVLSLGTNTAGRAIAGVDYGHGYYLGAYTSELCPLRFNSEGGVPKDPTAASSGLLNNTNLDVKAPAEKSSLSSPMVYNNESIPTLSSTVIQIPIHDMIDLNFRSKQEIYDLRKDAVSLYSPLSGGTYSPSDNIFGQIQDAKPWWGILGKSYYGNGATSILGPAEESRFITNPYLLVGLDSGHAIIVHGNYTPTPIYPIPLNLYWRRDRTQAVVKYDVTSFFEGERLIHDPTLAERKVTLVAYNARDFGWNYLSVSAEQSKNVTGAPNPTQILQFIHTGGSCGYPGGCNNMSPYQDGLVITVGQLPAIAYIKLWKNRPSDPSSPADMVFIIEMI